MTRPVRLQRSRLSGFNLRAASLAANGLECVIVTRPGKWGNPFDFRASEHCWTALAFGCRGDPAGRQEASVKAFRQWVEPRPGCRTVEQEFQVGLDGKDGKFVGIAPRVTAGGAPSLDDIRRELAGKNLACWCKPGAPCHADVLLEIANRLETTSDVSKRETR